MKKRTWLILAATALIAAGVSVKAVHSKKEKEEIEKDLKEVLIPDAEEKLVFLEEEHSDVLNSYTKQLESLQHQEDSLQNFKNIEKIDSLFGQLYHEWRENFNKTIRDLELVEQGEDGWVSDYEGVLVEGGFGRNLKEVKDPRINKLYKRLYYLTGNRRGTAFSPSPIVPVKDGKKLLNDSIPLPVVRVMLPAGFYPNQRKPEIERTYGGGSTDDVDVYMHHMSNVLWCMVPYDMPRYERGASTYLETDTTLEYSIVVLESLQKFVDNIDNSEKVFDDRVLQELKSEVKKSMSALKKLKETQTKKQSTTSEFQQKKANIEKLMAQQRTRLENYRAPNAVKRMAKERKSVGRRG